jgi:hypothetical protein
VAGIQRLGISSSAARKEAVQFIAEVRQARSLARYRYFIFNFRLYRARGIFAHLCMHLTNLEVGKIGGRKPRID